jgi:hypothetical protein
MNNFRFQALDKCQLGHLVRAKEEKLDSPGWLDSLAINLHSLL